jgi:hypothetical protein
MDAIDFCSVRCDEPRVIEPINVFSLIGFKDKAVEMMMVEGSVVAALEQSRRSSSGCPMSDVALLLDVADKFGEHLK